MYSSTGTLKTWRRGLVILDLHMSSFTEPTVEDDALLPKLPSERRKQSCQFVRNASIVLAAELLKFELEASELVR